MKKQRRKIPNSGVCALFNLSYFFALSTVVKSFNTLFIDDITFDDRWSLEDQRSIVIVMMDGQNLVISLIKILQIVPFLKYMIEVHEEYRTTFSNTIISNWCNWMLLFQCYHLEKILKADIVEKPSSSP